MYKTLAAKPVGSTGGKYIVVAQEGIEDPKQRRFAILNSETLAVHRQWDTTKDESIDAELQKLTEEYEAQKAAEGEKPAAVPTAKKPKIKIAQSSN